MPKSRPVRKAVLPVAGLGTRFLPATKAVPKEMLTVVDRPVIQHVVDEAQGRRHRAFRLRHRPQQGRDRGLFRHRLRARATRWPSAARRRSSSCWRRDLPAAGADELHPPAGAARPRPRGLVRARHRRRRALRGDAAGHAACRTTPAAWRRCSTAYDQHGGNVIAVEEVPPERDAPIRHRGRGRPGRAGGLRDHRHGGEAAPGTAPSNLYIIGRYILQPEIFDILATPGARRRQRDPAHRRHDEAGEDAALLRLHYPGRTYDTGSKDGFIMANVAYAMRDKALADMIGEELRSMVNGS